MGERATLRVSVIIPTYNRAGYLRQALDSVLAQVLPPWQVIVVDDGSTDETTNVLHAYRGRVQCVGHPHNQGISAARNSGLCAAQGDLIAWLDSDDLWEPTFLATVVPLLADNAPLDGVYTGHTMIDGEGATLGIVAHVEQPEELYDALVRDCFLTTPSLVLRKACYDHVGGFDPQFQVSEDYDMWLRIASQFRIAGIPQPLVRIRIHGANAMGDSDALCQARLALVEKHFGISASNDPGGRSAYRSAHGYALRYIAGQSLQHGHSTEGWRLLAQAIEANPAILERLDTFYELACSAQPRGYRGRAERLNIPEIGVDLMARLEELFLNASARVQGLRRIALGNTYITLAMLSDQAGRWAEARRYLLRAFRVNPTLLGRWSLIRRWLKLCSGPRATAMVRAWRERRTTRIGLED